MRAHIIYFKTCILCVQISTLEQEVKRLTNQASLFQHGLQDRIAELDLERVKREVSDAGLTLHDF